MQEWEVYILAKLNWNVPGLVATDFVDHILKVGAVLLLAKLMNSSNRALLLAVTYPYCTSMPFNSHEGSA